MRTAWGSRDIDRFYNGTVEAVMWIRSIDDQFYHADKQKYRSAREIDIGGRTTHGLHVVRGVAIHELIDIHDEAPGRAYPRAYPMRYAHAAWRSHLEARMEEERHEDAVAAYLGAVAGRPVESTLERAREFLATQWTNNYSVELTVERQC